MGPDDITRLQPIGDASGQVRRLAILAREMTVQKHTEARLREKMNSLAFVFDYTSDMQGLLRVEPEDRLVCVAANRAFLEVLRDAEGRPRRMLGAITDITDQKRTEEQLRTSVQEKEVLLREIHHRVKNNLQIVSSLLYLQSRKTDNAQVHIMLQESRDRIRAMSLIHQKLYQSADFARIQFAGYADELTREILRSHGVAQAKVAIEIEGNGLMLSLNHAVPCGLILSEVVTNSLKYAFPNNRRGTIRIALRQEAAGWCQLIISDTGVGLPVDFSTRRQSSLGVTLIERLVGQMQGKLERESSSAGTCYRISFPQPRILEDDAG
jgi:two-component sensor histidine kinase